MEQIRIECVVNQLDKLGSDLLGELLTIVEAIVPEKGRVDSAKSLVKQALWRRFNEYKLRLPSFVDSDLEE